MFYTASKDNSHEPQRHTKDPKSVEERQGIKRKTNDLETGDNKPTSVRLKKAKTTEEAPTGKSALARVTAHQSIASATPLQKPASATRRQKPAAPSQNTVAAPSKNSKKRSSLTDDALPDDPSKTPAPAAKKPRVHEVDTAHEGNPKNSQPIRRTGNISFDLKLECQ
jgi:hypothetical protein